MSVLQILGSGWSVAVLVVEVVLLPATERVRSFFRWNDSRTLRADLASAVLGPEASRDRPGDPEK
jgi:hypothetical protein